MDESQILSRLSAIGASMAAGQAPRVVFDAIVEAVQTLGFDRVRLDLVSQDGNSIFPMALCGFDGESLGEALLAREDPDLMRLFANPWPQVIGADGPEADGGETGERGYAPLLLRGRVIGKLTVDNASRGLPVSRSDLDSVALFAHQAAIAQAMLWAGSLETLQETTLAITSMRDRHTLLNTIIEQAAKLLDAKSGGLYEYRPELGELTVIADNNRSENIGKKTLRVGEGMAGRIIQDHLPHLVVADYNNWEGRAAIYRGERLFGAVLEVPLRWEERYIGVLYVDDAVGRSFSDTDIRLLQLFADMAAISLTNSNLLQDDEKKLLRLERLAQSTREMMGNLDAMSLQDRLMLIARYTVEILEAETSGVFRAHDGEIVLEASYGQQEEFEPGRVRLRIHDEPSGGLTGYIAYHGKLFKAKGEDLLSHPAVAGSPSHSPSGHCHSLLAIPLKKRTVAGERLIGLIRADNKKGEGGEALATLGFTAEDESILTIFAEAAAVALEIAELVDRLREQKDFQERLIASSPDGIIAVDREGRVTEFNKMAEEILGYTRQEVLDAPVFPLYVDAEEPHRIGSLLWAARDSPVRDHETAVRSKSGERIPIRHASTWLFDSKGERVGSVGYFADLRPQKALERRESLLLRASNVVARADFLDEGLQSLADMMVSLLDRSFCCILVMDEDGGSLTLRAASRSGESNWNPGRQRIVLSEWPGLQELQKEGSPAIREWNDERARTNLQKLSLLLGLSEDIRSLLVVPLKMGVRVVGQLDLGDLERDAPTAFPPEEIELVSAIAAQITVLVDRMEVLERSSRREELLGALVDSSVHIRGEIEMPLLLQAIVRLAAELAGCGLGGLFLNHPYLGQLELAAVYRLPEDLLGQRLSHDDGLIGRVARGGEMEIHTGPQAEEIFGSVSLQAIAGVPLRGAGGEIEAILFVGDATEQVQFGRADRRALEDFAAQATIALRTSRLIGQEQRFFSQFAILQRISDYIQAADRLEWILLTVLTGVTADFGLGFNRAMLMLVDETGDHLLGEMGVGELEERKAHLDWEANTEKGLNDFERFRRRLEAGEIGAAATSVGKKIRGLHLPTRGDDLFSEVVSFKALRRIGVDEFTRVPRLFLDTFRVTTPIAVAPLIAKGQVIGILVVDNKFTLAPIGDDSSNALMTFASTAAVAIDNKRLFDQTRGDAERLLSFYEMSGELISLQNPREILDRIVQQTVTAAGASWVSILLIDRKGRVLNPIISDPRFALDSRDLLAVRTRGISMEVMRTGRAVAIENLEKMRDRVNPKWMERIVKAAICLPFSLPGKRIGVMWIHYDAPRRFPDSEVVALQLYVNQAAIAYDSARQMERLEDLRAISTDLAEANDVKNVVLRIVDGARRVLKADETLLWLYDAQTDNFIPEGSSYSGDHILAWGELQKKGPQHRGTAFRIMGLDWMCIEDVQDPEQPNGVGPTTRRFLDDIGGRGLQGVALKVGREKLGVLYAIYATARRFDAEEQETAQAFASRTALALKKAKLLDQVQRAREAAEVVARVTLLEDPRSTLMSIAREVREVLGCGAVVLFEFIQETGDLILPPAMTGSLPSGEEAADYSLVLAMVERDNVYIVPNVARDERFKNSPFALAQGIKSCVAFPLKAAGRKVGVMFINYRNPRRFTADELTNMELFANQAAVAIRNAQLFDEGATKLAQQSALADLSRELLVAKSVQETMQRVVEFAARALDTEFCAVVLPDRENHLILSAAIGWEQKMVGSLVFESGEGSQTGYTIRKRAPVVVYDYSKVSDFRVPEIVAQHGIHSGLSVPMFREGKIVGAMLVHTTRTHRFTEDDEILLSLIANQAAIALERAQQYEASQRKSSSLWALYEASKAITAGFGMERRQILEKIVQPAMERIFGTRGPKAVLGTIQLYNKELDELVLESVYPPEKYADLAAHVGERPLRVLDRSSGGSGITGRAFITGKPQLLKDVREDHDYVAYASTTQSELAVPLLDRGKVIGVLNAESDRVDAFDEEDIEALQTLAELVVVAIQNARQVEELRQARQLVSTRTTLAWMGIGNAAGRHEMARSVGNLLGEIHLLTKELERTGTPRETIKHLESIKRRVLHDFNVDRSPAGRVDKELSSIAVNEVLIRKRKRRIGTDRSGRAVRLEIVCELADSARIRANAQWLDRVLDILINNALEVTKTLERRHIILGSRLRNSQVEIFVSDNGSGISEHVRDRLLREPIQKPEGEKGLGVGLLIAQAIIQIYGGSIRWEDGESSGTEMVIAIPLEKSITSKESAHVETRRSR